MFVDTKIHYRNILGLKPTTEEYMKKKEEMKDFKRQREFAAKKALSDPQSDDKLENPESVCVIRYLKHVLMERYWYWTMQGRKQR